MMLEGMDECKEFASPEGVLTADVNVYHGDQKAAEVAGEQADGRSALHALVPRWSHGQRCRHLAGSQTAAVTGPRFSRPQFNTFGEGIW